MCPPDYYGVDYVINPWMEGNVGKVDRALAKKQWVALYDLIKRFADVVLIDPVPGLPDMVFTANAGVFVDYRNLFVVSKMSKRPRRTEQYHFGRWAEKSLHNVRYLDNIQFEGEAFEGEGDYLQAKDVGIYGFGQRSTRLGVSMAEAALYGNPPEFESLPVYDNAAPLLRRVREGRLVATICLATPAFYHLDTCLTIFPNLQATFTCMYYPQATTGLTLGINDLIVVDEPDAKAFVCNAIPIGRDIIIPICSNKVEGELQQRGFTVHQVELSEFIKAGGAAKCLVLNV